MDNQNARDTQGKPNTTGSAPADVADPLFNDVSGENPKSLNSTDPKNSSSSDVLSSTPVDDKPVFGDLKRKQSGSTDIDDLLGNLEKEKASSADDLIGSSSSPASNRPLESDEQDMKETESIEEREQKRLKMQSEGGQAVECEDDDSEEEFEWWYPKKTITEVDRARTEEEAQMLREYHEKDQKLYEAALAKNLAEAKEREAAKSVEQRAEEADKAAEHLQNLRVAAAKGRKNRPYSRDVIKWFMNLPVRGTAELPWSFEDVDGQSSNFNAAPSSGQDFQEKPKIQED